MNFRNGLLASFFANLFVQPGTELAWQEASRQIADARGPGSARMAECVRGPAPAPADCERPALASPYRVRFASYLRTGRPSGDADLVPEQVRLNILSVCAFDSMAVMLDCELVEGRDLEAAIERQLTNPRADYLHVHFAQRGRYAARVDRE